LVDSAAESHLRRPTGAAPIRHHCSIYADDVILFMHPSAGEVNAIKTILQIFGDASGLRTNLGKCSITPIHVPEGNTQQLQAILGCQIAEFPITYLGLPLGVKKVPKAKIQSVVDAVARRMPACHVPLMNRSGRLIWIKSVLCAIPIYTIIADGLPPWAIEEINAIYRRFLWTGKEGSIRGKCMVAWPSVCQPMDLGGLGILDLRLSSIALQTRWLWLQQAEDTRAWAELLLSMPREVQSFFEASTYNILGDGQSAAFWMGRWIQGKAVKHITPSLLSYISRRDIWQTTVADGLQGRAWVRQITGGISVPATQQYQRLWDLVAMETLNGNADRLVWRWTQQGTYSSSSAYRALHLPSHPIPGCTRI
jgi:hypothetical protein